jgi:sugar lactone lactonase YvrE
MPHVLRLGYLLACLTAIASTGLSQSGSITTYVGPQLPVDGALAAPAGIISTVAGNGTSGFGGDGGPATWAQLATPFGVAVDPSANLFVADTDNFRIRKVTPEGIISTAAGSATYGFGGDGGPATSAQLASPLGVAVDASGNLFIADTYNYRIRKVTAAGIISTVAGNGKYGSGGDGRSATSAELATPSAVAVDPFGNLFIADSDNNRIRKVTAAGIISTVAGNGTYGFGGDGGPATSAQLAFPSGVAVDPSGNLFIADSYNNRIRKVTAAGIISTVAGNGTYGFGGDGVPAISAQLASPSSVAVDPSGNLFIADTDNCRIRKVTFAGIISTVAGSGTYGFGGDGGAATAAQLNFPYGVAVDASGNHFIADTANHRIRRVDAASSSSPTWVITMSKNTYVNGDTMAVTEFGPKNPSSSPAEVRITVMITIPTLGPLTVIDTTLTLPPNCDVNLGPLALLSVTAGFPPKGSWSFDATVTDPKTGVVLSQEINPFTVE